MMCNMKEIIGFPNYNIYNDGGYEWRYRDAK